MSRTWTGDRQGARRSPIEDILATTSSDTAAASRYGGETGKRRQQEREDVAETYPGMDIVLPDGSHRGVFYYDLSGGPQMGSDGMTITVPFRRETLIIRGYRLLQVFRLIMQHSLDIVQVTHRAEFEVDGDSPVIASVEIVSQETRH